MANGQQKFVRVSERLKMRVRVIRIRWPSEMSVQDVRPRCPIWPSVPSDFVCRTKNSIFVGISLKVSKTHRKRFSLEIRKKKLSVCHLKENPNGIHFLNIFLENKAQIWNSYYELHGAKLHIIYFFLRRKIIPTKNLWKKPVFTVYKVTLHSPHFIYFDKKIINLQTSFIRLLFLIACF